jgi:diacylglycerol kinase family enzyme
VVALLQHDAPRHISVAQLPLGTANDLASAAGISLVRCLLGCFQFN